ncbi:MAG: hypothetical protein HP495_14210 [Nitrospira sp.]|nr:hypothetical protein [Nitrospira sp.]
MIRRGSHRVSGCFIGSSVAAAMLWLGLFGGQASPAKDLLPPKEQETTEVGVTRSPSFDKQQQGVPQSLFTWIRMAQGYEVEWDTFGRKGWYAQDPRLKPVNPASVFTPETPVVYIVFEVAPLEDPTQFGVQWFRESSDDRELSRRAIGNDVLEMPGHERYGFLELKNPGAGWPVGDYVAELYIAPLGQQPFHAVNRVGTMHFTIVDATPPRPPIQSK